MDNTAEDTQKFLNVQFEILKFLHKSSIKNYGKNTKLDITSFFSVQEIAKGSLIENKDETLRSLYILEGQKLVTPFPPGDFTSNNWCLTEIGANIANQIVKKAA